MSRALARMQRLATIKKYREIAGTADGRSNDRRGVSGVLDRVSDFWGASESRKRRRDDLRRTFGGRIVVVRLGVNLC